MNILDSEKEETKKDKQNTLETSKDSKNSILAVFEENPEILVANLNDVLDLMLQTQWEIDIINDENERKQGIIRIRFVPPKTGTIKFIDFKDKKVILEFNGEEI